MHHAEKKASRRYRDLRSRLIARGYTLRSFAITHGYPYPTVYNAARGDRHGVKTLKIAQHLEEVAYA